MTVRTEMRVAAFELAQWLVFNWWRLRWESERPTASWRESHRLSSIGGGTVWPDITFASDLQAVSIISVPTEDVAIEPVQYISPATEERVTVDAFEVGINTFLDLVARRLRDMQVADSDSTTFLELLDVLRTEQLDAEVAGYRRMEATLGFDADQAPEHLILMVGKFADSWGENGTREVAASSSPSLVGGTLSGIENANLPNVVVNFESLKGTDCNLNKFPNREPYEVAVTAAKRVRKHWNLGQKKIDNDFLAKYLNVPKDRLLALEAASLPIGLAKSSEKPTTWHASFRKRHPTSRRFEVCRLIGDYLVAPRSDRLLSMTDTRTARQKFQRAFAQELLAPADQLFEMVGTYPDDDSIETAAKHFEVSPQLVATALVNRKKLDRSYLPQA